MRELSKLQVASRAYERDFKSLLNEHRGEWAFYHGAEQIGIYGSPGEGEREVAKRGISENEIFLRLIEEEPPEQIGVS